MEPTCSDAVVSIVWLVVVVLVPLAIYGYWQRIH